MARGMRRRPISIAGILILGVGGLVLSGFLIGFLNGGEGPWKVYHLGRVIQPPAHERKSEALDFGLFADDVMLIEPLGDRHPVLRPSTRPAFFLLREKRLPWIEPRYRGHRISASEFNRYCLGKIDTQQLLWEIQSPERSPILW